jgi:hydrogenase maturation protease
MTTTVQILGLGSPHGDDQAGWLVIDALQNRGVSLVVAACLRSPDELLDRCDATHQVVLCDACVDHGEPGTLARWNWPETPLPSRRNGTHDLALGDVLTLGQTLGIGPQTVTLWTITGCRFEPGQPASAAVQQAAVQLADLLLQEWQSPWTGSTNAAVSCTESECA